ncbi:MAG: hypothetical protein MUF37_00840 [Methanoregulaceae archaeon]|nr:hypothetical protein [Methanoregulaceae archaeon]
MKTNFHKAGQTNAPGDDVPVHSKEYLTIDWTAHYIRRSINKAGLLASN